MHFTVDKLPRRGRWIVFLCFLGISVAIVLLHRDYNSRVAERAGALIGILEETEADVRVRGSASYLWTPAEAGTQLFQNDAIQTGARGKARIRLLNGSSFQLEEETMVILDKELSKKKKDEKRHSVGHWAQPKAQPNDEIRSPFQKTKPRSPANE